MSDMPYALETALRLACGIVVLSSVFVCAFAGIKLVRADGDKSRIRAARKLLLISGVIASAAILTFLSLGTIFDFFYKPTVRFPSPYPGIPHPQEIPLDGFMGVYADKAVFCYDPIGDDSQDAPIPDILDIGADGQPIPNSHQWLYKKSTADKPGYCLEIWP